MYVCISISLSLYIYIFIYLYLSLYIYIYIYVFFSLSLSLSLYIYIYIFSYLDNSTVKQLKHEHEIYKGRRSLLKQPISPNVLFLLLFCGFRFYSFRMFLLFVSFYFFFEYIYIYIYILTTHMFGDIGCFDHVPPPRKEPCSIMFWPNSDDT